MSDFKFNCPHCKQTLEAPEEMLGQTIECPSCNGQIQISQPKPRVRAPLQPTPKANLTEPLQTQHQKPKARSKTHSLIVSVFVIVILGLVVAVVFLINRQTHSLSQAPALQLQLPAPPLQPIIVSGGVEGGAWVTKGGGQSDVIRGLTVYIINEELNPTTIEPSLRELRQNCSFWEKINSDLVEEYSNPTPADGVNMREYAPPFRTRLGLLKEYGQNIEAMMVSTGKVNTMELYGLARSVNKSTNRGDDTGQLFQKAVESNLEWSRIVTASTVIKGITSIDGRFSIQNVMPGNYVLYAQQSSALYIIEWCLPVSVKSAQTTKIDLFNDNAACTINKK